MSTPTSESYLQIDGFLLEELFVFMMGEPLKGSVQNRAANGDLHVVDRYIKETFKIRFPKLVQDEANQLTQILNQIGRNALHTILYGTPEIIRKWDDTTLPGYGINNDVDRIRKKIYIESYEMPHWDNVANTYVAAINCVES